MSRKQIESVRLEPRVMKDMVRDAIRSFCEGGGRVSNAQLYETLGVTGKVERKRLRCCLRDMVVSGEIIRVESAVYEYNPKYRPRHNETIPKLWKFVRTQKPGFTKRTASQLTLVEYTQAIRYFNWLEEEGYIERIGNDARAIFYRATDKAIRSPETPYPPVEINLDPFAKEKAAAARITTLMLCHDPYQSKTARDIVAACKVLLARFEKGVTQLENGGENK